MAKYINSKRAYALNNDGRKGKSDTALPKLVYLAGKIQFQDEKTLEEFIVENFDVIFPDLVFIKNQHSMDKQRYDIICRDRFDSHAVILELKNEVDRGVVPQVIRYRKTLVDDKPFSEIIDYSLNVEMICIAPDFHGDSFADKESSKFENDIHFVKYDVIDLQDEGNRIFIEIRDKIIPLNYPVTGHEKHSLDINKIPGILIRNTIINRHRDSFMSLRMRLLSLEKVKEFLDVPYCNRVIYGSGSSDRDKKIAEIASARDDGHLYLWLPIYDSKTTAPYPVGRFGLIMKPGSDPFDENSDIDWLVFTKDKINPKLKGVNSRQGMSRWSSPAQYLHSIASCGKFNVFFINQVKQNFPSFDLDMLDWINPTKTYQMRDRDKEAPKNLGFYIEIAILLWKAKNLNFRPALGISPHDLELPS